MLLLLLMALLALLPCLGRFQLMQLLCMHGLLSAAAEAWVHEPAVW
jgi:hypothetical protein